MNVKTDTKEKFTVITANEADLPANMTVELIDLLLSYLKRDIPHIVLNLKKVQTMDERSAGMIALTQQQFYEENASFIVCELNNNIRDLFDKTGLSETMNITFTESEAWDMLQMEEIERELLGGEG